MLYSAFIYWTVTLHFEKKFSGPRGKKLKLKPQLLKNSSLSLEPEATNTFDYSFANGIEANGHRDLENKINQGHFY